jgi:peptidoglycan/xylan/chitin deacetylase (PgdA/CDA1 family)
MMLPALAVVAVLLATAAGWLRLRTSPTLPVLMYHKIDTDRRDALTVSTAQFEAQLRWLASHGYSAVGMDQVLAALDRGAALPARPVLITFDDAFENNLRLALPILRRVGMTAVLFVPTAFLGGRNEWDGGAEPVMDRGQLAQMLPTFELALHSHRHLNYARIGEAEMLADLDANQSAFEALGLPFVPAFAYPYGGRPEGPDARRAMQEKLRAMGIRAAFRIGSRLNRIPLRDPYELQRLDIRGTDSLARFARKVRFGKLP